MARMIDMCKGGQAGRHRDMNTQSIRDYFRGSIGVQSLAEVDIIPERICIGIGEHLVASLPPTVENESCGGRVGPSLIS